jgi:tetratricopeptide (TPR) repeat protein
MAPDAGHSQHMTSHIFVAVGMWDDVVRANEAAVEVQNSMRVERGEVERHWGHYNFWLLYGYLQQGRQEKALELLKAAFAEARAEGRAPESRLILDPDRSLVGSVVQMWSRFIIDTGDWGGELAEWTFNSGDAFDPNLNVSFIKAMQAANGGQVAQSGQYLEQFRLLKSELEQIVSGQEEQAPTDLLYLDRLAVMEQELLAAIGMARGEKEQALSHAREANRLEGDMPFSFGPPFVDLPSAEFLGELLLNAGKYADAVSAFETQLERTRLRTASLEGLSRAHAKLGNEAEAQYTREKLKLIHHRADPVDR